MQGLRYSDPLVLVNNTAYNVPTDMIIVNTTGNYVLVCDGVTITLALTAGIPVYIGVTKTTTQAGTITGFYLR